MEAGRIAGYEARKRKNGKLKAEGSKLKAIQFIVNFRIRLT